MSNTPTIGSPDNIPALEQTSAMEVEVLELRRLLDKQGQVLDTMGQKLDTQTRLLERLLTLAEQNNTVAVLG